MGWIEERLGKSFSELERERMAEERRQSEARIREREVKAREASIRDAGMEEARRKRAEVLRKYAESIEPVGEGEVWEALDQYNPVALLRDIQKDAWEGQGKIVRIKRPTRNRDNKYEGFCGYGLLCHYMGYILGFTGRLRYTQGFFESENRDEWYEADQLVPSALFDGTGVFCYFDPKNEQYQFSVWDAYGRLPSDDKYPLDIFWNGIYGSKRRRDIGTMHAYRTKQHEAGLTLRHTLHGHDLRDEQINEELQNSLVSLTKIRFDQGRTPMYVAQADTNWKKRLCNQNKRYREHELDSLLRGMDVSSKPLLVGRTLFRKPIVAYGRFI